MNRIEFLNSLTSVLINNEQKKQLSAVYNFEIPEIILKILSKYPLPVLFDEKRTRTLSFNEVIHAEEDNGVSFASKNLIPVVDAGDNDYIVYNKASTNWCMYNIVDETIFNETDSFENLFLK